MLNRCEFIGNLGRDPEIRATQAGDNVASISLGVTEKWKDRDGTKQERTEWVRIVVFGKLVEVVQSYMTKGSKAYFAGKMQTRKWQDKDGKDRYSTEVVLSGPDSKIILLDSKGDGKSDGASKDTPATPGSDMDDEIPW